MSNTTMENTNQMVLNDSNVKELFKKCLYRHDSQSQPIEFTKVEGVYSEFLFDTEMLIAEKENIESLLSSLPQIFREGSSFWNMHLNNKGVQWTNSPKSMEILLALGIGIGKASYPQPKSMWWALPGGMPYVVIIE